MNMFIRTHKTKIIDNKCTQRYGGYITYFGLYCKMWAMFADARNKGLLTKWRQAAVFTSLVFGFPWWCIVKPLGMFYTTVTYTRGTYTLHDGTMASNNLNKSRQHSIFGVPVFAHSMKLTEEDELELIKND